jgi:hypothetical protein
LSKALAFSISAYSAVRLLPGQRITRRLPGRSLGGRCGATNHAILLTG